MANGGAPVEVAQIIDYPLDFIKVLTRQLFEKHRKKSMNLTGDTGVEFARRQRVAGGVLSPADGE